MSRRKRSWSYIYTEKEHRRQKIWKIIVYVLVSPVYIPLFLIMRLGHILEIVVDFVDEIVENVTEWLVFEVFTKRRK